MRSDTKGWSGAAQAMASLRRLALGAGLALGVVVGATAHAQTLQDGPPPQHRLVYRNALLARFHPAGLMDDARISYRLRLFHHESLALRDNFVSVGLTGGLSPAFGRVGVLVEVQPLTVLQLYGVWERVQYFGGFSTLQSFPSARSDFSDARMAERGALPAGSPLRHYAAPGSQLTLGANVQLKVGPVVARSQARLARADFALREGDRVFYDVFADVLAPNRGWWAANDADLLYQGGGPLTVGLRWTVLHSFYGQEHYAAGEPQEDLNGPVHRAGPLLAYAFFSRDGAAFNNLTVFLTANWWLQHRFRSGQQSSAWMPMVAAGLSFTGDLLPVRD